MELKKENVNIELLALGLKLEISADVLLNSLISRSTKKVLNSLLKQQLQTYLPHFIELTEIIKIERQNKDYTTIEKHKTTRNVYIHEYACLIRDLYSLFSDAIDEFNKENYQIISIIENIYQYSDKYGYELDIVNI